MRKQQSSSDDEGEQESIVLIDDEILIDDSSTAFLQSSPANSWKIIIIDDEPDVHRATKLALKNLIFEEKSLTFLSGYSAAEGKQLITVDHPDAALILLDVVMETTDAGLKLTQYIREELKNQQVRIILRTGHPGEAPEESVILNYDINDYKLKIELTRQKLLTSIISALRSYRDIITIKQQKIELSQTLEKLQSAQLKLEEYAVNLEKKVEERTADLAAANQKLYQLVTLDGLTLIANRRHFDDYYQQQWEILSQQNQPLSIILIDVDYFKLYNDCYGHQAGDDCLRNIAQGIKRVLNRPTDLAARYGGEEFIVMLPYASIEGAIKLANTVMQEIHQLNIPHEASPVSDRVTISLGICDVVPHQGLDWDFPIALADKALYRAKREGRNRFCL